MENIYITFGFRPYVELVTSKDTRDIFLKFRPSLEVFYGMNQGLYSS